MDHIPLPRHREGYMGEVPFTADLYKHDGCVHSSIFKTCMNCRLLHAKWGGYLARMGWSEEALWRGDFTHNGEYSPLLAGRYLHAWLYFGVLRTFCFRDVNFERFRKTSDRGEALLDSSCLLEMLQELDDHLEKGSEAQFRLWQLRAGDMFVSLEDISARHICNNESLRPALSRAAVVSIHLLHETLAGYFRLTTGEKIRSFVVCTGCKFLDTELRHRFWCPSDIHQMRSCVSLKCMAIEMGQRYHKKAHQKCNESGCVEFSITESDYVVRHETESCNCEHEVIQGAYIASIIHRGEQPLLVKRAGADIKLIAGDLTTTKYVAVSHVWADGIGNPHANSLPRCQTDAIQAAVDKLVPLQDRPVPWFLDTLCIPRRHDDFTAKARQKAVATMDFIYRHAFAVLVRDEELLHISSDLSEDEILCRVAFSKWSGRLWTLVEGTAASKIYIWFSDTVIDLDSNGEGKWRRDSTESITPLIMATSRGLLDSFMQNLRQPRIGADTADRVTSAFEASKRRTTSYPADQLLCITIVADLEPSVRNRIAALESEEQIVDFLLFIKIVPPSLVLAAGPRLARNSFRWCVEDIKLHWDVQKNHGIHHVTDNGLKGTWKSFFFTLSEQVVNQEPRQLPSFRLATRDTTCDIFLDVDFFSCRPAVEKSIHLAFLIPTVLPAVPSYAAQRGVIVEEIERAPSLVGSRIAGANFLIAWTKADRDESQLPVFKAKCSNKNEGIMEWFIR